jgi:hypothetical protein
VSARAIETRDALQEVHRHAGLRGGLHVLTGTDAGERPTVAEWTPRILELRPGDSIATWRGCFMHMARACSKATTFWELPEVPMPASTAPGRPSPPTAGRI